MSDTLTAVLAAQAKCQAADDAWSIALQARHGKYAGDARYRDQETQELDNLKSAFLAASLEMCDAFALHRASSR